MGVHSYNELKAHIGHNVVIVAYGDPDDPANVAVECEDCGCVLFDYDRPEDGLVDPQAELLEAGLIADDHIYKPASEAGLVLDGSKGAWDAHSSLMAANQARLDEIDARAKTRGDILARVVNEPFADGYAVYQVHEIRDSQARIVRCIGLGDDWAIPYWGDEAWVELGFIRKKLEHQDNLKALFSRHRENQDSA